MYDFDSVVERRPFNSVKWSYLEQNCAPRGDDVIPLWVADMDFPSPPEVLAAIRERAAHPVYGYAGAPESFFEAFRLWMKTRHGLAVEREHLTFSPGVVPGLALAINALTEPGDGVLIQSPVYHPFFRLVEKNDRRLILNPLVPRDGRYFMDFEDLEAKLDDGVKMMILCSPHNPVSRVWSAQELGRVAELADRAGVILVSDEIHCDLVYAPARHVPTLALNGGLGRRIVAFYAPSKTFNIAGLQTSIALIPDAELRRRFVEQKAKMGADNPNAFGVQAAEAAWRSGGQWLDELLAYLGGNIDLIRERITSRLPELRLSPVEGTYLAWIDFRKAGIEGADRPGMLHDFLVKKAGIWLDVGARFGADGTGFARLNFGCPRALLVEALDRLEVALPGGAIRQPRGV